MNPFLVNLMATYKCPITIYYVILIKIHTNDCFLVVVFFLIPITAYNQTQAVL
jgi:hypothetical protein